MTRRSHGRPRNVPQQASSGPHGDAPPGSMRRHVGRAKCPPTTAEPSLFRLRVGAPSSFTTKSRRSYSGSIHCCRQSVARRPSVADRRRPCVLRRIRFRHHWCPGDPTTASSSTKGYRSEEAKAKEITGRYRPKLEALLLEGFPKIQAINDQMEGEMRQILTAEQARKLDELKAQRPPMPPFGPPGNGGPPPAMMPPGMPGPGGHTLPPPWGAPPFPPPGSSGH